MLAVYRLAPARSRTAIPLSSSDASRPRQAHPWTVHPSPRFRQRVLPANLQLGLQVNVRGREEAMQTEACGLAYSVKRAGNIFLLAACQCSDNWTPNLAGDGSNRLKITFGCNGKARLDYI